MTTVLIKEEYLDENRRVSSAVMTALNSDTDLHIAANLGIVVFPGDVTVNRMSARANSGIAVLGSLTSSKTVSAHKGILIEGNCMVSQGDIKSQNGSITVKGKLFAADIKCGQLHVTEYIDCINVRAYQFLCDNLDKCTILGISNIVVTGGKNRTIITDNPLIKGDAITLKDTADWELFRDGLRDKNLRHATIKLEYGGDLTHLNAPHVDVVIFSKHEVSFQTIHCRNLVNYSPLFVTEWLTTTRDVAGEGVITVQGILTARKVKSLAPVNCVSIQVEKTVDTPLLRAYTSSIPHARPAGCVCGKCGKKEPTCKVKI